MAYSHPREYMPLFNIGKIPVWLTTLFTAGLALGVIATALLDSAHFPMQVFAFTAPTFLHGAIWQPLTYVWVDWPTFFTVFGLAVFYSVGIEFERYFARSGFLKLIATLMAVEVIGSLIVWWVAHSIVTPTGSRLPGLAGNYHLTAGMIVAFATLYPNIEFVGWLPMKWFVFACVAIGSLMYFPDHAWGTLMVYWAVCLTGFLWIRYQTGVLTIPMPKLPSFRKRPKLRALPTPSAEDLNEEVDEPMAEVDALLDKIAKSGIGSLSAKERARLEKAREDLMKRESPRR
jgi:hypothetical protein